VKRWDDGDTLAERLLRRSKPGQNDCRQWLGNITENGYGRMRWEGKRERAHRLAWIASNGPIPRDKFVCHKCDNPLCINVEHLFLGTHSENMRDMVVKGRHRRPDVTGLHNGRARLTPEQVAEIRQSQQRHKRLSEQYGVSVSHISAVKRGLVWGVVQ